MAWNPEDFAGPEVKAEIKRLDAAATPGSAELLALRAIAAFNITPDTGASVAMRMRDIACNAINAATARIAAKPAEEVREFTTGEISTAYSDWVWKKEGKPVGSMSTGEAARVAFFAGVKWAALSTTGAPKP